MDVYYLLDHDWQHLAELGVFRNNERSIATIKKYIQAVGQTGSIPLPDTVVQIDSNSGKGGPGDTKLDSKFRSPMLKETAVKVQRQRSIDLQLKGLGHI